MAEEQELSIVVKLKDQATEEIKKMSGSITKSLDNAKGASMAFAKGMLAGGVAIGGLGALAIEAASDAEQAQTAFTTMLGSAEKAQSFIADMKAFAAKTPFETKDISDAAQTMLAFGISSDKVMGNVQMLGDVALGNKEKFRLLSLAFAQVQSSGKLMGQDLLQMVGQGFNPLQIISEKTGKSMAELKEEMEKGAISADMVTEAFKIATSEGGRFYGGMEAQSKTFAGTLSTLSDNIKSKVLQPIGEQLLPTMKDLVAIADNFASNVLPAWIAKSQEIAGWFSQHKEALYILAGAIIGALVPAMWAWASATAVAAFNMAVALAPFIIGGAIIGGLIAAILWVRDNWQMLSDKATEIWTAITTTLSGKFEEIKGITESVFGAIKSYLDGVWQSIQDSFIFWMSLITGVVVMGFDLMGIDIVKVLTDLSTGISTTLGEWKATFDWTLGLIKTGWETMWNGINNFIGPIWAGITSKIASGIETMKALVAAVEAPMNESWSKMWSGLTSAAEMAWEGAKSIIKGSINWIIERVNKLIRSMNDIAAKGAGTLGIQAPTMATIPMLAEGGIVTKPTLVMAGEAGPEAIVPLGKSGGYAGNTYIEININGGDTNAVRREIEKVMRPLILNAKISH